MTESGLSAQNLQKEEKQDEPALVISRPARDKQTTSTDQPTAFCLAMLAHDQAGDFLAEPVESDIPGSWRYTEATPVFPVHST
jgi:hypothetical protein